MEGDDMIAPEPETIMRADMVLAWAARRGVQVLDVEPDVLGGMSVTLEDEDNKTLWISCMNSGETTAVWSCGAIVRGHRMLDPMDDQQLDGVLRSMRDPSRSHSPETSSDRGESAMSARARSASSE